jgi:hypothetical protein
MRLGLLERFLSLALLVSVAPSAFAQQQEQKLSPEEMRAKMAAKKRAFSRLREVLKQEPSAREVQRAVLKYYKLEPERISRMAKAARLKGLVPEIQAGIDNSLSNNFSNTKDGLYPVLPQTPTNPNPDNFKERVNGTSDSFAWRINAVWALDRLVFNSEELDVKTLNSMEETLIREVTTQYYSRRRLLANLILNPPEDEEERFYEHLRLDEMTSTLDALTGGTFGPRAYKFDKEID